jgi:hypothetical protein
MYTIKERIPSFIDADAHISEFETLEDLKNLPWIKKRIEFDGFDGFKQISVCKSTNTYYPDDSLMLEFNDTKYFFVLGFTNAPLTEMGLPTWIPPTK